MNAPFIRCGGCKGCKLHRQLQWRSRLELEAAANPHWPLFVTLTYRDAPDFEDAMPFVQRFFKRIRRAGREVRYLMATERGGATERVHHHGILWLDTLSSRDAYEFIRDKWGHGFVWVQWCRSRGSFRYTVKYCLKDGQYTWSRKLGGVAIGRWFEHVESLHEKKALLPGEVPAYLRCLVLGRTHVVRVPDNDLERAYLDLGVQYGPDPNPLDELLRTTVEGAPNGPLRKVGDLRQDPHIQRRIADGETPREPGESRIIDLADCVLSDGVRGGSTWNTGAESA